MFQLLQKLLIFLLSQCFSFPTQPGRLAPPKGALIPISLCQNGKMGYFESLAEQGFRNNLPSRVSQMSGPNW